MAAITGFLPELLHELVPDYYTDCVTVLHAIEENKSGRLCREWLPVPDPCDKSKCMTDIAVQFKHGEIERDEDGDFTQVTYKATVDFPFKADWITPQMRVQHEGFEYKIMSIQHDHDFATRLKLERVKR